MKNFMNKIKAKANSLAIRAKTTIENVKAEGYVDTVSYTHLTLPTMAVV